jgi:hypothetical protein
MRVFVADSLTKVFRESEAGERPLSGGPARIAAARNERESVQVVVAAGAQSRRQVTVAISDLRHESGQGVIPAGRALINPVGYVETERPVYEVDRVGLWPDPLLPLGPVDIPGGQRQPFWITVHVPTSAAPGRYSGAITVSADGVSDREVPVELRVWDFALGDVPPLPSAVAIQEHLLGRFYNERPVPEATLRNYWDMLFTHRLSSDNIGEPLKRGIRAVMDGTEAGPFDYAAFDDRVEYCFDRGLTAFQAAGLPGFLDQGPDLTEEEQERLVAYLGDFARHLEERGWLERAFAMVWDEPRDPYAQQVLKELKTIHRAHPGLRTRLDGPVTGPVVELCEDEVDIWGLHLLNIDRGGPESKANIERWRQKGNVLWMYVACDVRHPYPNIFIDYPLMDCRMLPWLYWKYDVEGFLYWCANWWGEPNVDGDRPEEKWPARPWVAANFIETHGGGHNPYNGDGHLIYPGPNGTALSSIRLEALRDGLEDYEYIWLLEKDLEKLEAEGEHADLVSEAKEWLASQELIASSTEWCRDPEALWSGRRELAELVVRVQRATEPQ